MRAALRALARRDLTEVELQRRLARAGFSADESAKALERLRSEGYLDDGRAAGERARALADRGLGDAAIAHDLAGRGLPSELVQEVLGSLEPEEDRAVRVARALGPGPRSGRALARKGFGGDAAEHALRVVADEAGAEVG